MIKAKKRYGQNFLKDESVKSKIIQAMPNDAIDIAEIGPGLGDLTQKLLEREKRVSAFEIDLELCDILKRNFHEAIASGELTLVCSDVLDHWQDFLLPNKYHLIANLPYYIATNIILKALEDTHCASILVMVQKEVALKFASSSGERNFSSLAILANSIAKVEVLFDVEPESFEPPPKVTSSILRIQKEVAFVKGEEEESGLFDSQESFEKFKHFLRQAFSAPRKTLLKNLKPLLPKEKLLALLQEHDLPQSVRPHQLSIEHYHLLFNHIEK